MGRGVGGFDVGWVGGGGVLGLGREGEREMIRGRLLRAAVWEGVMVKGWNGSWYCRFVCYMGGGGGRGVELNEGMGPR